MTRMRSIGLYSKIIVENEDEELLQMVYMNLDHSVREVDASKK